MTNKKLLKLITKLLEEKNVKSFEIKFDGNIGEYPGQIVKPIINIVKNE